MNQASEADAVAFSGIAFVIHQKLGHDKQGDTFHARRRAFDLGQHHVNDVVSDGLLAAGDINLRALDQIVPLICGRRRCPDIRKGGTSVGLGQGHGAAETTAEHVRKEGGFLLFVAKNPDEVGGSCGQKRVTGGAGVGSCEETVAGGHDRFRQLHATQFIVVTSCDKAGLRIGVEGFLHLRQHLDLAVDELWFVLVGGAVMGGKLFPCHLVGGFNDGIEGVAVVFAEALAGGEVFGIENFVELERQVAAVDQGVGHAWSPV